MLKIVDLLGIFCIFSRYVGGKNVSNYSNFNIRKLYSIEMIIVSGER